jgi:DNA-binding GntR family transcriptional regulator
LTDGQHATGFPHLQLKDRVYEHLRREIIGGSFAVGEALREIDISTKLGVSKTPVREAFVRLQKDRFVTLIPYRGAVVAGYSRRDMREIYEVRELLEGKCAARAAANASDEDSAALQRNIRASREALAHDRVDDVVGLFEEFDRLIYAQSDNKWITDLVDNVEGHQRRIGLLTVGIPGRLEHSLDEHEQICKAIVRRDAQESERLMRAHVASVMADQLQNFVEDEIQG